jgi:hypothetical protein
MGKGLLVALLPVLDHDGHGDLGVVCRGEGDEPGVQFLARGSAVPVFPATLTPGIAAPLSTWVTAASIMSVRVPGGLPVHRASRGRARWACR